MPIPSAASNMGGDQLIISHIHVVIYSIIQLNLVNPVTSVSDKNAGLMNKLD